MSPEDEDAKNAEALYLSAELIRALDRLGEHDRSNAMAKAFSVRLRLGVRDVLLGVPAGVIAELPEELAVRVMQFLRDQSR
jgi:hypothetical protein